MKHPLTLQQQRIWLLSQIHANNNYLWNLISEMKVSGELDISILKASIEELIQVHSALRTSIQIIDHSPYQTISAEQLIDQVFLFSNIASASNEEQKDYIEAQYASNATFVFDLSKPGLFRIHLVRLSAQEYYCILNFHHIIADAASVQLFWNDLSLIYNQLVISPQQKRDPLQRMQYFEYCKHQQNVETKGEYFEKQRNYWLEQYRSVAPVLNLPYDHTKVSLNKYLAASESITVPAPQWRQLSFRLRVALPSMLLAAFYVVLSKYSCQNDIIIGTFLRGRQSKVTLDNVFGMFINTVAIRINLDPEIMLKDILRKIHHVYADVINHQDYPYQELIQLINPNRSAEHSLFKATFNYTSKGELPLFHNFRLTSEPVRNPKSIEQDLTMRVYDHGESIHIRLDYNSSLFKPSTVARLLQNIIYTIDLFQSQLHTPLSTLSVVNPNELQMLSQFNSLPVPFVCQEPVHQVFEKIVSLYPNNIAAVCGNREISYGELNEMSERLSMFLLNQHVEKNEVIPVAIEHSIELLVSILALMKIGAVYLPIDPLLPQARKNNLLQIVKARYILTTDDKLNRADQTAKIISVVEVLNDVQVHHRAFVEVSLDDPVYAMFTSGTSGTPKAAVISNEGLLNRFLWMNEYFGEGRDETVVQTTRFIYDSSIWQLLWPLTKGGKTIIQPTLDSVSIHSLLDVIERHRVTTLDFIPSIFNRFVDELEAKKNLVNKLETLKHVIVGGEKINAKSAIKFKQTFPDKKVINLYGPTETTIGCVHYEVTGQEEGSIPIGRPINNTEIFIANGKSLCPIGVPGEIMIAGKCVGLGYLHDKESTERAFTKHPLDNDKVVYKTGDIGKFSDDGLIHYLGRDDHQIKLNGNRIELAEIESHILSFSDITQAVANLMTVNGTTSIHAFYVASTPIAINQLRAYLAERLPYYMVPVTLNMVESLPLTLGGKIDYKALPEPHSPVKGIVLQPTSKLQQDLCQLWANMLKKKVELISTNDNFFEIGGHSLMAFEIIMLIRKKFSVDITMVEYFRNATITALEQLMVCKEKKGAVSIKRVNDQPFYPLSASQKQMYILQQLMPDGIVYNMPSVFEVVGELDMKKLDDCVTRLVERHEVLRTKFCIRGMDLAQVVEQEPFISITPMKANSENINTALKNFIKPFDLALLPLFRIGVLKTSEGLHILIIDMHHIIGDAVSVTIFIRELLYLYMNEDLPLPLLQYRDFAIWENEEARIDVIKRDEQYWINKFRQAPEPIALPAKDHRNTIPTYKGESVFFTINKKELMDIYQFAYAEGVTTYMTLLTSFYLLLHQVTGQQDIVVGSPFSGRNIPELELMPGMFAKTLPIRCHPVSTKSFREFLNEVKQASLEAIDHQNFPLLELVKQLGHKRNLNRNPLFDVIFAFRKEEVEIKHPDSLHIKPYISEGEIFNVSKVDLTFWAKETNDSVIIKAEYNPSLFSSSIIENYIKAYVCILRRMMENPAEYIGNPILREAEQQV